MTFARETETLSEIRFGGAGRGMKELKLNSATTNEEQTKTREMLLKLGIDR